MKAYEYKKGEYVFMEDEDFEAAKVDGLRTIEIQDFVPYDEIDPIFFEKTYYLGPQDGAEKVYALLCKAMDESGLAGVARYVMRDRESLGCLRIRDGLITLEKMYFADEIRPVDDLKPGRVRVDAKELEMATQLIDRFSGKWRAREVRGHVPRASARGREGQAQGQGGPRRAGGEAGGAGGPDGGAPREPRRSALACVVARPRRGATGRGGSPRAPSRRPAPGGRVAAVADELERLLGLPLDEFTAARTEAAKRLRQEGDADAAAELQAVRKPTAAVWALNQAARREPGDVRALVRAAERVRQDPAGADADFRSHLGDVVRERGGGAARTRA